MFAGLAATAGRAIVQNPVIAGGGTALAVTVFYFATNALWYQPHAHRSMFIETRTHDFRALPDLSGSIDMPTSQKTATRIILEQPGEPTSEAPKGDPVVKTVQNILAGLDLYGGEVDGLPGPQTSKAIATYRKIMKLGGSDEIDDVLLKNLGAGKTFADKTVQETEELMTSSIPVPTPRSTVIRDKPNSIMLRTSASPAEQKPDANHGLTVKIQAGLREFGNDGIVLDGKVGSQTISAIREFQTLFGLPVTGKIDDPLIAKMEEIGLISL